MRHIVAVRRTCIGFILAANCIIFAHMAEMRLASEKNGYKTVLEMPRKTVV